MNSGLEGMVELRKKYREAVKKLSLLLWRQGLFVVLCVVFSWFTLSHLDFVPIWDGWAFFRECFQGAASSGEFRCFGHPAVLPSALYGVIQLIDNGNLVAVYILNLLLGIVSIVFFRILLIRLAGKRFSKVELTLLAFCFGLWPTFQVQIIQPGLDFPMSVFFVLMLVALFAGNYGLAALLGTAMSFCKEPGIALYGSSVGLYLLLLAFPGLKGFSFKRVVKDRIWLLALPAIPILAYVLSFPPQQDAVSWEYVIRSIFSFKPSSSFLHYQLYSAYLINFAWLFSSLAILGVMARPVLRFLSAPGRWRLPDGVFTLRVVLFLVFNLLVLTFLFTRVEFANDPRYLLPLIPLLVLLFAHAISIVPFGKIRVSILVVLLALQVGSLYRTIDPIAKAVVGTFSFGSHSLLQMSVPENRRVSGRGRDQLMYNGEIFNVHYLLQDIVRRHGLDAIYLADWCMTWIAFDDFRSFDVSKMERTLRRGPAVRMANMMIHEDFKEQFRELSSFPKEAFFIRFPNADICGELAYYLEYYRVAEKERFCRVGYCMSVLVLHLK